MTAVTPSVSQDPGARRPFICSRAYGRRPATLERTRRLLLHRARPTCGWPVRPQRENARRKRRRKRKRRHVIHPAPAPIRLVAAASRARPAHPRQGRPARAARRADLSAAQIVRSQWLIDGVAPSVERGACDKSAHGGSIFWALRDKSTRARLASTAAVTSADQPDDDQQLVGRCGECSARRRLVPREALDDQPRAPPGRGCALCGAPAPPSLSAAANAGNLCAVRAWLWLGGSPDAAAEGRTLLHLAAARDHAALALLLISAGASLEATQSQGCTPLALAALAGAEAVLRVLLRAGADPNTSTSHGISALALASHRGHFACARHLCNAGARNDVRDMRGQPAMHYAKSPAAMMLLRRNQKAAKEAAKEAAKAAKAASWVWAK